MPRTSANANVNKPVQGDLPDVNVWLALLNAQHVHHQKAKLYWEKTAAQRMVFCRITMLGLLRLSTNKVVMGGAPYTQEQAWQAYQAVLDLPEVTVMAEPPGLEIAMRQFTAQASFRPADWTDTYLAAFAQVANLRLVSFDKGFTGYAGLSLLSL
jgi:uncharacterized protein